MIVQDNTGALYNVRESADPSLAHCYIGYKVKRGKTTMGNACFKPTIRSKEMLIRKAQTKIIQNI